MLTEQKRARHNQYFQPLEKGEGGYLAVTSPINDSGNLPVQLPPPRDANERWLCTERRLKSAEAAAANTYYGLDAIQYEFVNLGPGVQAALLGAPYRLEMTSIWFDTDPPLKSWSNPPAFITAMNHPLHKVIDEHTRKLCAASNNRWAVSVTDIGGTLDVLFSLRGEELLTDFIEYPEEVIAMQEHLDREFMSYYNKIAEIIKPAGYGHATWMPIVSDTPYYPIQCDISALISPAMFEKFALPSLDRISTAVGCGIYHLDGPGEIPHLDMLLSLKNVHAIQWTPLPHPAGVGAVYPADFNFADELSLDVYRRAKAAGKKVAIFHVDPGQVETIYDAVGSDGVFILVNCRTRKDADEFIAYAKKKNWLTE